MHIYKEDRTITQCVPDNHWIWAGYRQADNTEKKVHLLKLPGCCTREVKIDINGQEGLGELLVWKAWRAAVSYICQCANSTDRKRQHWQNSESSFTVGLRSYISLSSPSQNCFGLTGERRDKRNTFWLTYRHRALVRVPQRPAVCEDQKQEEKPGVC